MTKNLTSLIGVVLDDRTVQTVVEALSALRGAGKANKTNKIG